MTYVLTAKKHNELAKHILRVHALTGGDNIPALSGIGKKRALNTLTCFTNESKTKSKKQSKSNPSKKTSTGFFNPLMLAPVGDIFADMDDVLQAGS